MKDYVALQIDAINLRTLVRAQRMGCEDEILAAAMLPGGRMFPTQLKGARGDHLTALTHGTPLSAAGELAAKLLDGGGSLTEFERACDDALMTFCSARAERPLARRSWWGILARRKRNLPPCVPFIR